MATIGDGDLCILLMDGWLDGRASFPSWLLLTWLRIKSKARWWTCNTGKLSCAPSRWRPAQVNSDATPAPPTTLTPPSRCVARLLTTHKHACPCVKLTLVRVRVCVKLFVLTSPPVSKKTKQNCVCHNFVEFPQTVTICGKRMAISPNLYEMPSFYTSPNSRQRNTVLNAYVPNWYAVMLKLLVCSKLSNDLICTP